MGYRASRPDPQAVAAAQRAAELQAQKERQAADAAFRAKQAKQRPGVRLYRQNQAESQAGIRPPSFEGMRDIKTGELLKDYTFDPYAGEAVQRLKSEAFGTELSPWAQMKLATQKQEELAQRDQAAKAGLQALTQGQSNLAMTGGLSSGARERMARGGARDLMMAKQGVGREGMLARLGIQTGDIERKQGLMGTFADTERQAQEYNIGQRMKDIESQKMFDANRYNQQMQAWGAAQTAAAQRQAAADSRPSGKCFVADTLINMVDGTKKKISKIIKGDVLALGGKVLMTLSFPEQKGVAIYDYRGVKVTGRHAVFEEPHWVRVEDSSIAVKTDLQADVVYNLITENHIILANDVLFSDDVETVEDYKNERMSLATLNGACF